MKKLNELFDIRNGHSLELNRLQHATPADGFPFVSRKMGDNGIAAYVAAVPDHSPGAAGELTCALSGNGVLSTFIQNKPYYTAYHVACLSPKVAMTAALKLYYCTCIYANRYRYGWGRQANRSLKDIVLPEPHEAPAWIDEVAKLSFDGKDAPAAHNPTPDLNPATWKSFKLASLFDIKKGKRLTAANMRPGKTVFIGAIDNNNGLTALIDLEPVHPAGTITVNYNGNGVAEAFYQPTAYRCSDDVNVLYPKFTLTPAAAMFISAVIRLEKYRFSYGRKWHLERMAQAELRLPATIDGTPDWDFIEKYVNTLPYSSQL